MQKRMNWNQLFSFKRVADYSLCEPVPRKSQLTEPRSPFEKDFDQLTFSYPFRRLQDKLRLSRFQNPTLFMLD